MNREILFRGQIKYNGNHLFAGEWVEGSLIVKTKGVFIYVIEKDQFGNIVREFEVEVVPETVGQFTGLTDKNGVRIFEGDIVKTTKRIGVCVFYLGCFVIDDLKETTDHDSSSPLLWEVIGNIHDTPNLLTK